MFMNENKFSSNGDHQEKMALHHQSSTLISTTGSSDQQALIITTMSQNSISESSNSTVSSRAVANNALVGTDDEIIVKDQLPSPQYSQMMLMEMRCRRSNSFNSSTTHSHTTQFNHLEIPGSKNSIRSYSNSETVMSDIAFDEKATEFFNSQFYPSTIRNGMCSRGSTKPAFEKALVPSLESKLRKLILNSPAHETTEFANAEEENSGSKRITDTNASLNGSNSRKRKEISRGTAKDLPPPPPVKNGIGEEKSGVKLSENRNFQRQLHRNTRPSPEASNEYIHVRGRRGQATDSHSLAERVRREKINKRMKLLQDLVPGCHKITGKAVMLDEIINYVQSLQRQVQFLSMKLATVNPSLDFNVEALASDDMLPSLYPPDSSTPIIGECEEAVASQVHMVGDDDHDELQSLIQTRFGKM